MKKALFIILLLLLLSPGLYAQIGFDSATDGGLANPATSLTWNHTVGINANRIIFVGAFDFLGGASSKITSVTCAGTAMTKVGQVLVPTDRWVTLWVLVNPPSGVDSITITTSTSTAIAGQSISYFGAKQSGEPEAFITHTASALAANQNFTTTLTTLSDNAWAVIIAHRDSLTGTQSAGAGTTARESNSNGLMMGDSGAAISPAQAYSMSWVMTAKSHWGSVMASIAPAANTWKPASLWIISP